MIDIIYLDLDGVLGDFVSAAIRAHGRDPEAVLADEYPRGDYDALPEACGATSPEAFWRGIPDDLWESVPAYPWRDVLWEACEARAPTFVLTSPALSAASAAGKVRWLQAWKGPRFRNYILSPVKTPMARYGAVLVDDADRICRAWEAHGGRAILFPAVWNSGHGEAGHALENVLDQLRDLR